MKKVLTIALAAGFLLTACEQDASKPSEQRPKGSLSISGYDAELIQAEVRVYRTDEKLRKTGEAVFTGTTDDFGRVVAEDFDLPDQFLLVEVGHAGHYFEEATGTRIELEGGDALTSIQYYEAGDELTFTASGYTHIATSYMQCLVSQYGENASNAIGYAGSAFSSLTSVDVFTTLPVNPSLQKATGLSLDKPLTYGILHAAVSKFMQLEAESQSLEPHSSNFRSIDFYKFAAKDIAQDENCALDGVVQDADGERITLGLGTYEFNEDTYRVQLARAALEFLRSDENKTAVKDTDFLQTANVIASAENSRLFNGLDPKPLDDEGPVISLPYEENQYFGGVLTYAFDLEDYSGVREVELFLDGVSQGVVYGDSSPEFSPIFTTDYADGPHEFTIVATDNSFATSELTHEVIFWNASPIVEMTSPLRTRDLTYDLALDFESPLAIASATVNGGSVVVNNKSSVATVSLSLGINEIPVTVTDELGGTTETSVEVFVDRTNPRLILLSPNATQEIYYSADMNVNNTYSAPFDFSGNASDPYYFQDSNVAMGGDAVTNNNLANGKYVYIDITVTDDSGSQPSEVITASADLLVTYSYLVDNEAVFENRELAPRGEGMAAADYVLPFTEEYLVDDWFLTTDTDKHKVVVYIEDEAGNVAQEEYVFRVRYFPGNPVFDALDVETRYNNYSLLSLPNEGDVESVKSISFRNEYDFDVMFRVESIEDGELSLQYQTGIREAFVRETIEKSTTVICDDPIDNESFSWAGGYRKNYFINIDEPGFSLKYQTALVIDVGPGVVMPQTVRTIDELYEVEVSEYEYFSDSLPSTDYDPLEYGATVMPSMARVVSRHPIAGNPYQETVSMASFIGIVYQDGQPVCPLKTFTYTATVDSGNSPNMDLNPDHVMNLASLDINTVRETKFAFLEGFPRNSVTSNANTQTLSSSVDFLVNGQSVTPDPDGFITVDSGSEVTLMVGSVFPDIAQFGGDCSWDYTDEKSCDQQIDIQSSSDITYSISTFIGDEVLNTSSYSQDFGLVPSVID